MDRQNGAHIVLSHARAKRKGAGDTTKLVAALAEFFAQTFAPPGPKPCESLLIGKYFELHVFVPQTQQRGHRSSRFFAHLRVLLPSSFYHPLLQRFQRSEAELSAKLLMSRTAPSPTPRTLERGRWCFLACQILPVISIVRQVEGWVGGFCRHHAKRPNVKWPCFSLPSSFVRAFADEERRVASAFPVIEGRGGRNPHAVQ